MDWILWKIVFLMPISGILVPFHSIFYLINSKVGGIITQIKKNENKISPN